MHVFIHAISYLTPKRSMNMIWFLKVLLTSRSICLISVEYFLACSFIVCNNIKTKMIRNNACVINNFEFCRHYRPLLNKWTGKKNILSTVNNSDIFKKIFQNKVHLPLVSQTESPPKLMPLADPKNMTKIELLKYIFEASMFIRYSENQWTNGLLMVICAY